MSSRRVSSRLSTDTSSSRAFATMSSTSSRVSSGEFGGRFALPINAECTTEAGGGVGTPAHRRSRFANADPSCSAFSYFWEGFRALVE
jgi:hypothetical protein